MRGPTFNNYSLVFCLQHRDIEPKRDLHYPLMLYEGFDKNNESSHIVGAYEGAANIVYFVWCGKNRLFEFKHMLAVLSAIKVQQPLRVILYHYPQKPPIEDLYNNWLSELRSTFYNFEVTEIAKEVSEPQSCVDAFQKANSLSELLKTMQYGGIYMDENIILNRAVNRYRHKNVVVLRSNGAPGVVIGKNIPSSDILRPQGASSCTNHNRIAETPAAVCLSMDVDKLYPRDIMTADNAFAQIARTLFYGSKEKKEPHYDLSDPIPNIGHFYLIGENTVNFFIYLSIYSMISVLKVDMVYLHGDIEPNGDYWQRLLETKKVKFVFCPPIQTVFGNAIDPGDKCHGKDILSVYFLYLYGGVFIDWDAIFTRPLDDAIRGYDAVVGYDWFIPDEAPTFPETINPGVLAAKRHSVYMSTWLEKYKDFGKKGSIYYTGLLVPYKLYEHYPETVKLDTKFQVICWQQNCHPPWMPGYTKPNFHSEFDWEQVYSVHFTSPDPHEFSNEKQLRNATTTIGHMGQRVMGWY